MATNETELMIPRAGRKKKGLRVYRRKYHVRAICQSVAFACVVVGFCLYNGLQHYGLTSFFGGSAEDSYSDAARSLHELTEEPKGVVDYTLAPTDSLDLAVNGINGTAEEECESIAADPAWMIVFHFIGVLYMFLALAIVCDEFFVPALEEMSSSRRLNMSMDVAGATLMAAGGSAPELFTSLFGTFAQSEVGFGTIVGSAVFNVLFVIAMCALMSKEVLSLTWWPLFRDSFYYAIGLGVLAVFVGVNSKNTIELWEAIVLFAMYLGYVLIMWQNANIYKAITGKELEYPDEDDDEEEDNNENGDADDSNGDPERPKPIKRLSASNLQSATDSVSHFRWQGTFRAGILKLLRDPESWIETAGVGIVAKIAGDADYVFKQIDTNGDGTIDRTELMKLFEVLDCHLSQDELTKVFRELDINGDGEICEDEFSKWYIQSEERIRSQVRHVFDEIDANKSGTIDRKELKTLLETLDPRVTDADVEEAIGAMYKSGSREEITFDEFDEWYRQSILFERQKKAVEEDMHGVMENLMPPWGEGVGDWLKYLLVLPLVLVMSLTIPDVRRPGMSMWCYFAFFLSIAWIGGFAYLMVTWAEVIGVTIGIPDVVMGLTILAAGTSVPDMLSSVIVARRGEGDMAVSSSIGSNIFDILVGLPVPWMLFTLWPTTPSTVYIGSDGLTISILILLGMLVFVIAVVHCQGWKLTNTVAVLMLFFYFGFLAQAVWQELPFEEDAC